MKILRFSAPFKPDGKEYTRIGLWNRYIRSKMLLIATFIPSIGAIYFMASGTTPQFIPFYTIVMLYPVFNVGAFLWRVKTHFKYRSPYDTAMTEFTFMDNGILMEQKEMDHLTLYHWDKFDMCYELKDYLLLYKQDALLLVLDKKCMTDEQQVQDIRQFVLEHLPSGKKVVYKRVLIF